MSTAFATTWMIVAAKQTVIVFGMQFDARYTFFFLILCASRTLLFMMSLMLSGVAAGTAIGYVGQYGNNHTGWMEICDCDRLKKYGDRVTASSSMVLSHLSVIEWNENVGVCR
ncbi:hypothetical protein V6N11_062959 [Hibiscus sabdariffa]|uniref:CASP-like protein n=1 Tax=Hibiscus sabdariffa TaxID=183260 RepID=A0ABR2NPR7_9ROSI